MVAAPNLLVEETARAIERLQRRLEQQRARLTGLAQDSWEMSQAASKIAQMERGLERLRFYNETLKSEGSFSDKRLVNERNQFAKQWKRKWRPSRTARIEDDR
jgi:alcohol dehydrogenase YqhD (iron-dependent ADH family)